MVEPYLLRGFGVISIFPSKCLFQAVSLQFFNSSFCLRGHHLWELRLRDVSFVAYLGYVKLPRLIHHLLVIPPFDVIRICCTSLLERDVAASCYCVFLLVVFEMLQPSLPYLEILLIFEQG